MLLMLDLVVPRWAATALGLALGVLLLSLWAASPVVRRRDLQTLTRLSDIRHRISTCDR